MRQLFLSFSSLRLTVVLLAFSMVLVFFGTLDQVHFGIHETQKRYFESLIAIWQYPLEWPAGENLRWFHLPMPGGYLLGGMLLINLVAAHFRYYRPGWKRIGIVLIHAGIVLLIVSGFLTSALQQESGMWIDEGSYAQYSQDFRDNELVLIDRSPEDVDRLISIPVSMLIGGEPLRLEEQGITITTLQYMPNASIGLRSQNPGSPRTPADRGAAVSMDLSVFPQQVTYAENETNTATALLKIESDADGYLGTWLVSNIFDERFPTQVFTANGTSYEMALRFKRYYYPFRLHLKEFRHDRYPGTDIPRNFSSLVRIDNPETGEDRQALIYMNHPLRYAGLTFYQASFGNQDTSSMLQVVRNPGWLLPYLSVLMVGVGMTIHFILSLITYLQRSNSRQA